MWDLGKVSDGELWVMVFGFVWGDGWVDVVFFWGIGLFVVYVDFRGVIIKCVCVYGVFFLCLFLCRCWGYSRIYENEVYILDRRDISRKEGCFLGVVKDYEEKNIVGG